MHLPSISYLLNAARHSLLRFPLTLICAFFGVCLSIYLIEFEDSITNYFPYINSLITFALGIPLFFCVSIFCEKSGFGFSEKVGAYVSAAVVLLAIYLSLPNAEHTHNTAIPYIRYGIFNLIVHLLVSFSPYTRSGQLNGFWNFNKTLFIRILTSILYSGFLYVGLILALSALHLLFDIDIKEELYFELWVVIIGLFTTWFFLSGIPKDIEQLEVNRDYPRGLKIFAQYVLLPLLVLYLIILYAYGAKITILWDWPKGIVSYLISCVSVLGILTVLLFYPYGEIKENAWIKKSSKIFYLILYPLIALLFFAITMRISDYGMTINRYVILLLGIWLTMVATYFTLGRSNIKFIPMSLAITLGLMSFGPWGMFTVSEKSQVNRLISILEQNDLLENGKVKNEVLWEVDSLPNKFFTQKDETNEGVLSDSLHNEVYSIVNYLDDFHGFSRVRSLFMQNVDSLVVLSLDSSKYRNEADIYMRTMGFAFRYMYVNNSDLYFGYSSKESAVIPLDRFDYLAPLNMYNYKGESASQMVTIENENYKMILNQGDSINLRFEGSDTVDFALREQLDELILKHGKEHTSDIHPSEMTLAKSSNDFELKVIIKHVQLQQISDTLRVTDFDGGLLLKRKD